MCFLCCFRVVLVLADEDKVKILEEDETNVPVACFFQFPASSALNAPLTSANQMCSVVGRSLSFQELRRRRPGPATADGASSAAGVDGGGGATEVEDEEMKEYGTVANSAAPAAAAAAADDDDSR